jgi:hypothetical protein
MSSLLLASISESHSTRAFYAAWEKHNWAITGQQPVVDASQEKRDHGGECTHEGVLGHSHAAARVASQSWDQ